MNKLDYIFQLLTYNKKVLPKNLQSYKNLNKLTYKEIKSRFPLK